MSLLRGPAKSTWRRIGTTIVPAVTTSIEIAGLDGDSDGVYYVVTSWINGNNAPRLVLQPNGDSTTSNYSVIQTLSGNGSTVDFGQFTTTGLHIAFGGTTNYLALAETLIYARSGTIRPALSNSVWEVSGTTINEIQTAISAWQNTSAVVRRLILTTNVANGLGAGTRIEVYSRR